MDIRAIVKGAMKKTSANKLAKLAKVPPSTTAEFLKGKSPINSDALGRILDVLDLRLMQDRSVLANELEKSQAKVVKLERELKYAREAYDSSDARGKTLEAMKWHQIHVELEKRRCSSFGYGPRTTAKTKAIVEEVESLMKQIDKALAKMFPGPSIAASD